MKKRHQQKLLVVSWILFVALNLPVLLLFNSVEKVVGLPFIYVYLFSVWSIAIIITYIIVKRYYE